MKNSLFDFYGDQVIWCANEALRCLRERQDLIEQWVQKQNSASKGFAEHLLRTAIRGSGDEHSRDRARDIASFAMRWAYDGMPRLLVSHKLAASLACTSIPEELCDAVEAPWKRFVLVVPQGLAGNPKTSSVLCEIVELENGARGCRLRYQQWGDFDGKPVADARLTAPWSEFAGGKISDPRKRETSAALNASLTWHASLVFGCCLELQNMASAGSVPMGASTGNRRSERVPTAWNIQLTRPVRNDMRQVASQYLRGNGSALAKQLMVRGHWKNQPHGPSKSQRKFIHIEPYWRGPEDAPIAVRPHVLSKKKKAS